MSLTSLTSTYKIAIIGLGYVGLPLAVAFGKYYRVMGLDINEERINELKSGIDRTRELTAEEIAAAVHLRFTHDLNDIRDCNVYIITVPTPLDASKAPDLQYLLQASEMIGSVLTAGDLVIYESTVYPGCTEEDCVPVLERVSGLVFNKDFYGGYSPERINPGDKARDITAIKKVTSGSTPAIATLVDELYGSIITAGTHKAPSIKVAEAAKAIENAQRDLNISFMNELVLMFDKMGIDTGDVLEAAATKWNFLPFKPGLVGGHCIGVDPHYLAHKAIAQGYHPKVILSGREVNEQMGVFVAEKMIAALATKYKGGIAGRKVLILGFAFKENCPDTRNTKVVDVYHTLKNAGLQVAIHDPWVDARLHPGIGFAENAVCDNSDGLILAVKHDVFRDIDFEGIYGSGTIVFDTQGFIKREWVDIRM